MAFQSQVERTKRVSRRRASAPIMVAQTYKESAKSEEISFRVSSELLKDIGLSIGMKADVLYDKDDNKWMIRASEDGFSISGKPGAPSGLIRYTLKVGHARLTEVRADLPVRRECDTESISISEKSVVFMIKQ